LTLIKFIYDNFCQEGKSVNKDGLFKQVFTIHSLDEQTKIANLFSSLDESIRNLKKQKDQLTKRKTHYLNNMFI
ncbi:MAG: hypothetical protein KFW07_00020, partial [Mycoplasmataceae bacterium]|nr:hypothetical protein [Mycoplasmataceae bacterium]